MATNPPPTAPSEEQKDTEMTTSKNIDVNAMILEHKNAGNTHFAAKRYPEAIVSYRAGLDQLVSSHEDKELKVALRSNLAVALLRVHDYSAALEQCNLALAMNDSNPKVWYRRGLAQEGLASSSDAATTDQKLEYLQQAQADLRKSLEFIESFPENDPTNTMKPVALKALNRVQQSLASVQQQQQQQHGSETEEDRVMQDSTIIPPENGDSRTNGSHYYHQQPQESVQEQQQQQQVHPAPPPLAKRQCQDVLRLLYANSTTANTAIQGEAFFLLDWNWWTRWCFYVELFSPDETERNEAILKLLPPGAVLPTNTNNTEKDDDSTSSSSTDSENEQKNKIPEGPPGEIDNSALFQILSKKQTQADVLPRLKPNLVRGHHYELVPREVYNALRIWYGEATPTICRRVEIHQQVAKLPLYTDITTKSTTQEQQEVLLNGQACGACQAPSATCRCTQCFSVYYCGRSCQESHWKYHKLICKQLAKDDLDSPSLPLVRNDGRVGLHNLGNTCFMNSALQCLSHATPLTRYFLSNQFKRDVNTTNPLGTGGQLAHAYESVVKDIWLKTDSAVATPSELKRAIATYAPRFAGISQQDAQEFLAYLLDGLHEDLNRIQERPYVQEPEVGGRDNMLIAGAKAWDLENLRHDSLVRNVFYGQFKSTCVCPQCNRVSVRFDAFNHVSLEIPQVQDLDRVVPIILFRTSGEVTLPSRYGVTVKRGSFAIDLRKELSEMSGIPLERLMICDVYEHSIFEIIKDNKPVSTIRNTDVLVAYEVDPFDDDKIHTVASQVLVHDGKQKQQMDVTTEMAASADLIVDQSSLEPFGFPILTAFDLHSTCRHVWDHVWETVTAVVARDFFSDKADDMGSLKSLLRIRVVDNNGKSCPVFLEDVDMSDPLSVDEEMDRASLLPPESDEELMKYLGKDCADRFLFLRLEWTDQPLSKIVSSKDDEGTVELPATTAIDVESFHRFENHVSLEEALQKIREAHGNRGVTLDKCFEAFTKPERLDENNMWYCSKCKEHVRAMKTMQLWRLPDILVVALKRFEFKHILRRDKLDTFVNFPLDGLDMSKHCASTQSDDNVFVDDQIPQVYDLFAVTNHYGRLGFGHYTAFARRWDEHGMSDDWALFDDSSVHSVGDGRGVGRAAVVSPAAYVLFYRRRTSHS